MVRLALLFLIAAALVVLVLSNLSPVALTFLGTKTLALPLGIWVVGAIGAGALTIGILSGLFRLSRPVAPTASARRPGQSPRSSADRFKANSSGTPWFSGFNRQDSKATGSSTNPGPSSGTHRGENRQSSSEAAAWDDWDDSPNLADRQPASQTRVRDTEDDEWADWDGFEDGNRRQPPDQHDAFEEDDRRDRSTPIGSPMPLRTDFEVKRDPETRRQSGSVYSYSYRRDEDEPEPIQPTAKPGEVYDADYRVITPPYHPDPEEVMRPPDRFTPDRSTEIQDSNVADSTVDLDLDLDNFYPDQDSARAFDRNLNHPTDPDDDDDEDWGLDDEPQDRGDRPRR